MIRFLGPAGESHGPALVAILDGIPAGLSLATEAIDRSAETPDGGLWPRRPHEDRSGPGQAARGRALRRDPGKSHRAAHRKPRLGELAGGDEHRARSPRTPPQDAASRARDRDTPTWAGSRNTTPTTRATSWNGHRRGRPRRGWRSAPSAAYSSRSSGSRSPAIPPRWARSRPRWEGRAVGKDPGVRNLALALRRCEAGKEDDARDRRRAAAGGLRGRSFEVVALGFLPAWHPSAMGPAAGRTDRARADVDPFGEGGGSRIGLLEFASERFRGPRRDPLQRHSQGLLSEDQPGGGNRRGDDERRGDTGAGVRETTLHPPDFPEVVDLVTKASFQAAVERTDTTAIAAAA
jgi:hypothetical protein